MHTPVRVLVIIAVALAVGAPAGVLAQTGAPIVTPPIQAPAQSNVMVNVTPPPPDPAATAAMYSFSVATVERDHVHAPVTWASSLLSGTNIWTTTPVDHFRSGEVGALRNGVRLAAMGLFLLALIWTGIQLALGSALGTGSAQLLLPPLLVGFLLAVYSDTLAIRSIDLNNWLCERMGTPSLGTFTGDALTLPELPELESPGTNGVPQAVFEGIIGSLVYALVLIVLELKLILREAVLIIGSVVMPIAGVLWAAGITRGWGIILFRLFFGWLFGQPLVVACLALAGSLLGLLNLSDSAGEFLVKIAILFAAIKLVSIFAGGGLGDSGMFGLAGVLFLMRRAQSIARRSSSGGGSAPAPTPPAAPPQPGVAGGTGGGSAATGRPWRPALGGA